MHTKLRETARWSCLRPTAVPLRLRAMRRRWSGSYCVSSSGYYMRKTHAHNSHKHKAHWKQCHLMAFSFFQANLSLIWQLVEVCQHFWFILKLLIYWTLFLWFYNQCLHYSNTTKLQKKNKKVLSTVNIHTLCTTICTPLKMTHLQPVSGYYCYCLTMSVCAMELREPGAPNAVLSSSAVGVCERPTPERSCRAAGVTEQGKHIRTQHNTAYPQTAVHWSQTLNLVRWISYMKNVKIQKQIIYNVIT